MCTPASSKAARIDATLLAGKLMTNDRATRSRK